MSTGDVNFFFSSLGKLGSFNDGLAMQHKLIYPGQFSQKTHRQPMCFVSEELQSRETKIDAVAFGWWIGLHIIVAS